MSEDDPNPPPLDPPPPEGGGEEGPEPVPAAEPSTPWEDQRRLGLATAFVETTRRVLLTPAAFFRAMPTTRALGAPLAYGLVVGMLGIVASWIYLFVFQTTLRPALGTLGGHDVLEQLLPAFQGGVTLVLQILFAPIGLIVRLFVTAGIVHIALLLLGGAARGFEATFRVIAYGEAPAVLGILPFCGELAAIPYRVVVLIIGLSEAHGTSRGTAAAAVLIPIGLACCCCGTVIGLGVYFFAAALGLSR